MPATVCCGWERVAVETEEDIVGQCLWLWLVERTTVVSRVDSRNKSKLSSSARMIDGTTIMRMLSNGLDSLG